MSTNRNSDYTAALVAAHRGESAATLPGALPGSLDEAMQVQGDVARALRADIAGWKTGFTPERTAVAGPLYADVVQRSPATQRLPARGFIVEVELAFRLARDLPARRYTREEILDAVSEALVGIELVRGRFGEPPEAPYPAFVADNIGNAGYVVGDATAEFRSLDLAALPLRFEIDGAVVQDIVGGHPQGDPVEPLRAYAEKPLDKLGGLRRGQIITTGSLTKPLRIDRPAQLRARLRGIGEVVLALAR